HRLMVIEKISELFRCPEGAKEISQWWSNAQPLGQVSPSWSRPVGAQDRRTPAPLQGAAAGGGSRPAAVPQANFPRAFSAFVIFSNAISLCSSNGSCCRFAFSPPSDFAAVEKFT